MEIPNEILTIQRNSVSDIWNNNLTGYFIYDSTKIYWHFIETTSDGNCLIEPENVQLNKNPLCVGFMAYLIYNLGKMQTDEIYKSYIDITKNAYKSGLQYEPFYNSSNAEYEFYELYFLREPIFILTSNRIYSFIQKGSVELIQQYIKSYEEYIKVKIKKDLPEKSRKLFTGFKDLDKYRFHVDEVIDRMKIQYFHLREEGFISCEENTFLFRMGYNVEVRSIDKIKWIKKNKKSNLPNKMALLDYLTLIGINESEIKNNINTVFEIPNGGTFKSNNYSYVNGHLTTKSEYHDSLDKIVRKSKE